MAAEANGALATALIEFLKEAPAIRKDSENPHFHSKFASLDSIMAAVRPVLATHGLAISQHPTATEAGMPALRTILLHSSGDRLEDVMPLAIEKPGPQAQGSALTYARRYAVLAVLGLVADEDDDATAAEKPQPRKDAASPATPPAPLPEAGDAAALTAELLVLAEKLDATGATMEAIENNAAKGDPARHVEWLKKCIATATEQLALDDSPYKQPEPKPKAEKKSPLPAHAKRVYAKFKSAEEKGQLDKAGFDEFMAERGYTLAKLNEDQARDVEAFIANQEIPF